MPRKGYKPQAPPLSDEMRKKEQERLAKLAPIASAIAAAARTARAETDRSPGWEDRKRVREGMRALRARRKNEPAAQNEGEEGE